MVGGTPTAITCMDLAAVAVQGGGFWLVIAHHGWLAGAFGADFMTAGFLPGKFLETSGLR